MCVVSGCDKHTAFYVLFVRFSFQLLVDDILLAHLFNFRFAFGPNGFSSSSSSSSIVKRTESSFPFLCYTAFLLNGLRVQNKRACPMCNCFYSRMFVHRVCCVWCPYLYACLLASIFIVEWQDHLYLLSHFYFAYGLLKGASLYDSRPRHIHKHTTEKKRKGDVPPNWIPVFTSIHVKCMINL